MRNFLSLRQWLLLLVYIVFLGLALCMFWAADHPHPKEIASLQPTPSGAHMRPTQHPVSDDPWVGKTLEGTSSWSWIVANPEGIGRFKVRESCKPGAPRKETVVARLKGDEPQFYRGLGRYYLLRLDASAGTCPVGTLTVYVEDSLRQEARASEVAVNMKAEDAQWAKDEVTRAAQIKAWVNRRRN
jgi:hypothetical protein